MKAGLTERRIKGSLLKITIKPLKANKTGIYQEILTETANNILKERIFDSVWYPYAAYKDIFNALCKIEAKNNPKIIIEWGKKFGEIIMTSIYKGAIVEGSIKDALNKYARFHKLVFSFGAIKYEIIGDNDVIVTYADFDPDWEYFHYIALGWLLKYLELCMGKKINYQIVKKSWEGADATSFQFTW
ncbi:MAG: hypothetical protein JW891_10210 [Candidatus Lokiarchaeota archaeon]|nr:hypothetical protein [Candidatus Lokiarchaeota archaeon]